MQIGRLNTTLCMCVHWHGWSHGDDGKWTGSYVELFQSKQGLNEKWFYSQVDDSKETVMRRTNEEMLLIKGP